MPKIGILLFFATVFVLGLVVVKDYGLSIDEPTQRRYGEINWNYVVKGDPRLLTYKDRIYGPAFELFLYGVEKVFRVKDSRSKYLLRHILNFMLYVLALWFFYLLCKQHFKHWVWGVLGVLVLILSPRLFAHAFINSKDLPFLSLFIISMYTLQQYLEKKNWKSMMWHALCCALVVDIRVLGLLVPLFTVLHQGWDLVIRKHDKPYWKSEGLRLLGFGVLCFLLVIAFWPTLWKNPFANLFLALKEMSRFPWLGEMLYLGSMVKSDALPWHYALVWIFITTPLAYTLSFMTGLILLGRELVMRPKVFLQYRKMEILFVFWFILPLGAVIIFQSVLYNGWRHLFFIYPAMVLIAIHGAKSSFCWIVNVIPEQNKRFVTVGCLAVLGLYLASVLITMIRLHPNQHLFFQKGIGGVVGAQEKFEMDYWGLTFYQGLKTLLTQTDTGKIKVFAVDPVLVDSARLLSKKSRQRLIFVKELDRAQYYLDNGFRALPTEYPHIITHALKVDGVRVLTIAQLENQSVSWEEEQKRERFSRLAKNIEMTQDKQIGQVANDLQNNIRLGLANYIRNTQDIEIMMEPFSTEKIRRGEFEQLRIRAREGELGDFQHKNIGIPFEVLDITVSQLVVDLQKAQQHKLEIISLGNITVNEIELQDQKVNQALTEAEGDERKLRLFFKADMLQARWLDKPNAEVDLSLDIKPDTTRPTSDNLWFEIKRITVNRIPMPKTLVHWGIQAYNPLIPMKKLPGDVKLGELKISDGILRIQKKAE
jgi:dolichyl-phosphate-mannose-protein mannosyltransferase